MVDWGLKILNDDSRIQIDSVFKNHAYYDDGSGSVSASDMTLLSGFTAITDSPVTFFKVSSSGYAVIHGYRLNGSVYDRIRVASSASFTFYWLMFRETQPQTPSAGDYGLLVYDSAGDLVFSSLDVGFIDVVGIYSASTPSFHTGTTNVTVDDAVNNYFQLTNSAFGYRAVDSANLVYYYLLGIKYINSTTIQIGWVVYHTVSWPGPYDAFGTGASGNVSVIEIVPPPGV